MATPRMPSLIPRRPKLVHYAFAAVVGWATSYYTFQPLLEQQVSGHSVPARPRMAASSAVYANVGFACAQARARAAARGQQPQSDDEVKPSK